MVIPPMQICPGDLLVYGKCLSQRKSLLGTSFYTLSHFPHLNIPLPFSKLNSCRFYSKLLYFREFYFFSWKRFTLFFYDVTALSLGIQWKKKEITFFMHKKELHFIAAIPAYISTHIYRQHHHHHLYFI